MTDESDMTDDPSRKKDPYKHSSHWPKVIKSVVMAGASVNALNVLRALYVLADFYEPRVDTRIGQIRANSRLSKRSVQNGLAELRKLGVCVPVGKLSPLFGTPVGGAKATSYWIQPYWLEMPQGDDYHDYGRMIWEAVRGYFEFTHPYQFTNWVRDLEYVRTGALDVEGKGFLITFRADDKTSRQHYQSMRRHIKRLEELASEYSHRDIQIQSI